jgi:hypothetical protein
MDFQNVVNHLFFPIVVSLLGLMVNCIRKMTCRVGDVATNIKLLSQELHIKLSTIDKKMNDHELRLRNIEHKTIKEKHYV